MIHDTCFRAPSRRRNFGLRFSAPAPTRPGGAAAGTPRGTKTEAAKCDAIVLQKKNIPFPVRSVFVRTHTTL
jgi:hypothetical protein